MHAQTTALSCTTHTHTYRTPTRCLPDLQNLALRGQGPAEPEPWSQFLSSSILPSGILPIILSSWSKQHKLGKHQNFQLCPHTRIWRTGTVRAVWVGGQQGSGPGPNLQTPTCSFQLPPETKKGKLELIKTGVYEPDGSNTEEPRPCTENSRSVYAQ